VSFEIRAAKHLDWAALFTVANQNDLAIGLNAAQALVFPWLSLSLRKQSFSQWPRQVEVENGQGSAVLGCPVGKWRRPASYR
jgi:hypothetical protein